MLTKRSEADIRAAQAIKNNQDFIYATNVALNLLRDEIKVLKLQIEKERAERGREIQAIKIHIENAIDGVIHDMAAFDAEQTGFGHSLNKNEKEINCLATLYKCVFGANQEMERNYDKIKNFSQEQAKQYEKCLQLIQIHSEDFKRRICSSNEALIRQFTVKKPEVDPLEVKLNDQIEIIKNDHRGLYKEINLLKKTVEYGEKKFEAIFSKIEMKKAG
jgi:hypothetical protein